MRRPNSILSNFKHDKKALEEVVQWQKNLSSSIIGSEERKKEKEKHSHHEYTSPCGQ
jgi:transposase